MKQRVVCLKSAGDILTPAELKDYHDSWGSIPLAERRQAVDHRLVGKVDSEHSIIGKVWQYKGHPLYRASVISSRLPWISMDPPQPIWHEYHYWQALEQMYVHARNENGLPKRTKVPMLHMDLQKPIWFGQRMSIELIPEVKWRETKEGIMTIEDNYFTLYNIKNETHAHMFIKTVSTKRHYESFYEKAAMGDLSAQEHLIKMIDIQKKRLGKLGRTPKVTDIELKKTIESSQYNPELLKNLNDFFSFWDLPSD